MSNPSTLTPEARDKIIIAALKTKEGKAKLWAAIQLGFAKAADLAEEGSFKYHLARRMAGLPDRF